jgi:hypothetical protein
LVTDFANQIEDQIVNHSTNDWKSSLDYNLVEMWQSHKWYTDLDETHNLD